MNLFKKNQKIHLPNHIAIIMDGNGRWAKKRGLHRNFGHKAGAKTLEKIAEYSDKIGICNLTVYAFSTENWKRPKDEVDGLMELFYKYLKQLEQTIEKRNIKVNILGDITPFSQNIKDVIKDIYALSEKQTGSTFNICINYGARQEILNAFNQILAEKPERITEQDIEKHLYTKNLPDPDLIIRPSGEKRISNFLLWQMAYSEFYFTDVLWPDFDEKELDKAILEYSKRNRRFGGV